MLVGAEGREKEKTGAGWGGQRDDKRERVCMCVKSCTQVVWQGSSNHQGSKESGGVQWQ